MYGKMGLAVPFHFSYLQRLRLRYMCFRRSLLIMAIFCQVKHTCAVNTCTSNASYHNFIQIPFNLKDVFPEGPELYS